jgi:hypothetical protein
LRVPDEFQILDMVVFVFLPDPFGQAEGLFGPGDHGLPVSQEFPGIGLGLQGCRFGRGAGGYEAALEIRHGVGQAAVQADDPAQVLGDALDRFALGYGRSNVRADGRPGFAVYFDDQFASVLEAPIPSADRLRPGDR